MFYYLHSFSDYIHCSLQVKMLDPSEAYELNFLTSFFKQYVFSGSAAVKSVSSGGSYLEDGGLLSHRVVATTLVS